MKIGLFGFGCVGSGVYNSIKNRPEIGEIKKVCVRNIKKHRNISRDLITDVVEDILGDPDIDVIIELIDDSESAFNIVKKAIIKGVPVISANKKMIAENIDTLNKLTSEYGTPVFIEGAVAGSIPVISILENHFKNQEVLSIRGLLNGSTNYILSLMADENCTFNYALKKAQKLGFAESNPSLDIYGLDTYFKSKILACKAFNKWSGSENITVEGINSIDNISIQNATRKNKKIKLISEITLINNNLNISISPQLISANDLFFQVNYENNAVEVTGSLSGTQHYFGKGAGSLPTTSAVLHDLYQVSQIRNKRLIHL